MKSGRRRNNRLNKTSWKKIRIMTITKIIKENRQEKDMRRKSKRTKWRHKRNIRIQELMARNIKGIHDKKTGKRKKLMHYS